MLKDGFKSKNVVISPIWKFKSIKAIFSLVILDNSRAKFVAREVFPIPPLLENTEIILQLFVFENEPNGVNHYNYVSNKTSKAQSFKKH